MRESYEKRQKKWVEKHNVEVGDFVTVMQKYDIETCGDWVGAFWIDQMNRYVKKTGKIVCIEECGIRVDFGDGPTVKYWFPYSVLRKEKEMKKSYEERQAEWIKKNDLKIGDPVRLIRAASNREDGWPNMWPSAANEWVGKTLEVRRISELNIACYNPEEEDLFAFPYFVLEKINEEEYKKMTDGERYIKRQAEWVKANNLKPGDEVKILRKAGNCESGWPNIWVSEMDSCVGKILEVRKITEGSVVLYTEDGSDWWQYPYFVLEKVMEHKDKEWGVSYGLKVKTGDPVLVRDDEDENWRYALFSDVLSGNNDGFRYRTCGLTYSRCIPYVGNEHLVGTTDDYKAPEEPTKSKFVFGAKVKATLSCGEEKEGVLIGFDKEDDDTPFEVVVQDEDASFNYTTYWVKEITYID